MTSKFLIDIAKSKKIIVSAYSGWPTRGAATRKQGQAAEDDAGPDGGLLAPRQLLNVIPHPVISSDWWQVSKWEGSYWTALSADDIDGLDFKIPEVDLDVPDIDIGGGEEDTTGTRFHHNT